jgi:hypothetical protein
MRGLDAWNDLHDKGLSDVAFDAVKVCELGLGREGDRNPRFPVATRAPDAVDIVFRGSRQIEIDHMADPGDIKAASRNI